MATTKISSIVNMSPMSYLNTSESSISQSTDGYTTTSGIIPVGGIIMWSGGINSIPKGWTICNGATVNGITTPNLTDKFVVGVGYNIASSPLMTGGYKDAVVVAHTHTFTPSEPSPRVYSLGCRVDCNDDQGFAGSSPNPAPLTIREVGESGVNKNLPPYMGLYYIMRVS